MLFKTILILASIAYMGGAILIVKGSTNWSRVFIVAGLGCNILALVSRGYVAGRWYVYLMTEEVYALPAAIALVVLGLLHRHGRYGRGIIFIPLVLAALVAVATPYEPVIPTVKGMTITSPLFFLTESVSAALFLMAGVLALDTRIHGVDNDYLMGRLIMWGFIMFTLCQIAGAVWAFLGWSYPFSWSTRHLLSTSIWCLYAALLHIHLVRLGSNVKTLLVAGGMLPLVYMIYHHELTNGFNFIIGVLT